MAFHVGALVFSQYVVISFPVALLGGANLFWIALAPPPVLGEFADLARGLEAVPISVALVELAGVLFLATH